MNKNNLKEIVQERDAHVIHTQEWEELNLLKNKVLSEQKPSTNEIILYFKEEDLKDIPMGYSNLDDDLDYLMINLDQQFNSRFSLEYASGEFRHPIPYIVLKHEDKYFFILRESGSGETRLIGKKGLVGGHVGSEDECDDAIGTIVGGMGRELLEEVGVDASKIKHLEIKGLIRSNDGVDADHLGVIFLVELNTDDIKAEEEGILSGIWIHKDDLHKHYDSLENWSRIVYDNILSK